MLFYTFIQRLANTELHFQFLAGAHSAYSLLVVAFSCSFFFTSFPFVCKLGGWVCVCLCFFYFPFACDMTTIYSLYI